MRKRIITLVLLALLLIPQTCYAAGNPYPKTQTFDGVVSTPCTRVVWKEAHDRLGISLPGWGNAVTWYKSAADAGYKVGSEAKANSIAVYSGFKGYGHVAYVTEVSGDTMQVVENKGSGEGKRESTVSRGIGAQRGDLCLLGFIYINEAKTSGSPGGSGGSSGSSAGSAGDKTSGGTASAAELSGDSSLKSLTVENFALDFQKDNFYYELSVPYETESVAVAAQAESEKAAVEYDSAPALEAGDNVVEIKVVAEDKSESVYVLKITREEAAAGAAGDDADGTQQKNAAQGSHSYLIFIGLAVVAAAAIATAVAVMRKGKSEKSSKEQQRRD